MKKALIALENGYYDYGYTFASQGTVFAEFVFNTAMTGYEEILTDPSYKGQIVLFTYPLIGNYGITKKDGQSDKIHAEGAIIREYSNIVSNFRAETTLKNFLENENRIGIHKIDTRALTKQIRTKGAMKGGITTEILDPEEFLKMVINSHSISDDDMYKQVIADEIQIYKGNQESNLNLLAIDFGIKSNIITDLQKYYKTIYLVPFNDNFEDSIKNLNYDGVFLSNGPGDPRIVKKIDSYIKKFVEMKKPVIGICFGHQLIGQTFGLDTYKMPFGHHGGNHPVLYHPEGKVYITSQNHNYAISKEKVLANPDWEITWENLFDNTVAGIRHKHLPIASVQYHPEASPGPNESNKRVFDDFFEIISNAKNS
jgi:carbamoyl-phosphate synthase small subunit